ncbi:MAG: hypothetical protein PSV36_10075 [Algoriphagus sp.]|nr:hypothetical protein [Algoriphagus sp.]
MLDKIQNFRNFLKGSVSFQAESLAQSKELEWAHIYHDSIRGKDSLQNLGLNVGRWAGNYSFFYILNRILSDYQPKGILEMGLGESSKFISTYLTHYLFDSHHTVVEQDQDWINAFSERFKLCERSKIVHCPIVQSQLKGFPTLSYQKFEEKVTGEYDLFIVDGPFGSDRFSRFDIVSLVEKFEKGKEFILIIDDSHREGEQDTILEICSILSKKGIVYLRGDYSGVKQNTIIASEKYKFSTSL